jgi:DNA-binding transcriptional ArsR family regulator
VTSVALTPEVLDLVAERFKALAEPARLQLLERLRGGERSVSALAEETGLGQANVSKHLQMLHALRFVTRRKEGLHVYYALADERVFTMCDMMCGRIERELAAQKGLFAA